MISQEWKVLNHSLRNKMWTVMLVLSGEGKPVLSPVLHEMVYFLKCFLFRHFRIQIFQPLHCWGRKVKRKVSFRISSDCIKSFVWLYQIFCLIVSTFCLKVSNLWKVAEVYEENLHDSSFNLGMRTHSKVIITTPNRNGIPIGYMIHS